MEKINLRLDDGSTIGVEPIAVCGPLFVHFALFNSHTYSISHITTGRHVGAREHLATFDCRRCCIACAEELSHLDWDNFKSLKVQIIAIIEKWKEGI